MKIESITLKNFRAFKNASMADIPRFCVLVGANGTGKSTLFQVFGFLRDAMKDNVTVALTKLGGSRGIQEVRSRNSTGPIEIELKFRENTEESPLITYYLAIDEGEKKGRPVVTREILRYRRGQHGAPWHFLDMKNGKGKAVTNELEQVRKIDDLVREEQVLKSPDILAIKGLAQFERFPAVRMLGDLIENWHISDFHISEARSEPDAGYAEHLSTEGRNLAVVTEYLYKQHPNLFMTLLKKLENRVPGVTSVTPKTTDEGKVLLRFGDAAFKEPFLSRYVSDGTIKMFAYLVLLYDPAPHPLLCVEEPENQLYPKLLLELAEEFRSYAERGQQVFVSTHSPDFLDAVELDELFWLVKEDGYTTIHRANENDIVREMMQYGDKLGRLWLMDYFTGVDPQ